MNMIFTRRYNSNKQSGFTLIEIILVVAIIGILAAIAIPRYQDNVTRAQVSEAFTLLGALKQPLSEYGVENNAWPIALVGPNAIQGVNEISVTLSGNYSTLSNTVVGTYPNGVTTATINTGKAAGTLLKMTTADGGSVWACGNTTVGTAKGTGSTVNARYLPNACKP
ncbi:pilin [Psychrobacter celer]